jgi:hypothetical protein
MTEIINRLPNELANIIYSYVGMHPVAKIIDAKLNEDFEEFCIKCKIYLAGEEEKFEYWGRDWNCYDGKCEYCYAEEFGTEIFTCVECCEKSFECGTNYTNTENGLYCTNCYSSNCCVECGEFCCEEWFIEHDNTCEACMEEAEEVAEE